MKTEIKCENCKTEIVINNDKLFFSEEEINTIVSCPICHSELLTENTDGWLFVQTKKEYLKDLEIEENKPRLTSIIP